MRSATSLPTPTGEWAPVAVRRATTAIDPTPVWPRTVQVQGNYYLPLKSDVTFHSNFLSSIYTKLNEEIVYTLFGMILFEMHNKD